MSSAVQNAEDFILSVVRDKYGQTPDPEDDIIASGLLDSFAFVELVVGISEEFQIRFDLEDLDKLEKITVSSLAAWVAGKTQQ